MNKNNNKKYFKRTFEVIHAPDNLTQEVLNMAKNLDNKKIQKDILNKANHQVVYSTVEVKSHRFNFRGLVISCCCVAVVGGSILALHSFNRSDVVSIQPNNNIGYSNNVEVSNEKILGLFDTPNSADGWIFSFEEEYKDKPYNMLSMSLPIDTLNTLLMNGSNEYLIKLDVPSEDVSPIKKDDTTSAYIELSYDDVTIFITIQENYMKVETTPQNDTSQTTTEYYQTDNDGFIFNEVMRYFDNIKKDTTENFMGRFQVYGDISVTYQYTQDGSNWESKEKNVITESDISLINDLCNLNDWSEISQETYCDNNYKYNSNITPTEDCNITFINDDNQGVSIFMINGVMELTYFNVNNILNKTYYQCDNIQTFNTLMESIKNIVTENTTSTNDDEDTYIFEYPTETDSVENTQIFEYSPNDTAIAEYLWVGENSKVYDGLSTIDLDKFNQFNSNKVIWTDISKDNFDEIVNKPYNDYLVLTIYNDDNVETKYYITQYSVLKEENQDEVINRFIWTGANDDLKNNINSYLKNNYDITNDYSNILSILKDKSSELKYVAQFNNYSTMELLSGEINQDIIIQIYEMLNSHEYTVDNGLSILDDTEENIIISNKEFFLSSIGVELNPESTTYTIQSDGKIIFTKPNDENMPNSMPIDYYVLNPNDGSNLYHDICDLIDNNIQNCETETEVNLNSTDK